MRKLERFIGIPETTAKEWMSLAYVQAICAQAGLNISNWIFDNGIDLNVGSSRPVNDSGIANVSIALQLKATECWNVENEDYIKYDLPVKNYNQLRAISIVPQYLVLFTLPSEQNNWIQYQLEHENHNHVVEVRHMAYYLSLKGEPETTNRGTIRVEIPVSNKLTTQTLIDLYENHLEDTAWMTNQR